VLDAATAPINAGAIGELMADGAGRVGADSAGLGVSDGAAETLDVAVVIAEVAAVATAAGVDEASTFRIGVIEAVVDAAAIPGVDEATADAALEGSTGAGVDAAIADVSDGVGEATGVGVTLACAVAVTTSIGVGEAAGSRIAVRLASRKISVCPRLASARDASPCALASKAGTASIQIDNPISNARKVQARGGRTITIALQHSWRARGLRVEERAQTAPMLLGSNPRQSRDAMTALS